MINTKLSQDIYKILIHGKIINRRCYDPVRNAFAEDELFQELSSQYEGENGYRALYERIGCELVLRPAYAYLKEQDLDDDESSKTATAIQALLTVIAKTALSRNYRFELLTAVEAGFSRELAADADQDPEMRRILSACHCRDVPLWDEINRLLFKRNIAFANARGSLVLSYAGQDFFAELFARHGEEAGSSDAL